MSMAPVNKLAKKANQLMRSSSKRQLFKYDEGALKKTLEDIKEHGMGIRAACRLNNVPRSTIQDRLQGRIVEKKRKIGPDPVLGIEGEQKISKWVVDMAKCGFPIRKRDLLETVAQIVKDSGKLTPFKDGRPGEKWYRCFSRRHKEISIRVAESINRARAVVTEGGVRNWFTHLKEFLDEQGFSDILDEPDRIFNGDETGFSLCPKSGKVLAPRGYKNLYEIKNNEKDNITVYVSFNASGKICPPLVVLPYLRPPKAVIDNVPKSWVIGRSDTGWMKGSIFYEYMANEFNDWLGSNNIKKPCIVFVDGHKSHMTLPLSQFCEENQIILYALPPNTTHMLQPADVSVFKPLKQQWKTTVINWQRRKENLNSTITKINFCKVFAETMTMDMKTAIMNGFRKCGLYPFNPDAVDYSKCVKDTFSKLKRKSNERVTAKDLDAAIKVLLLIGNELRDNGIDTDLILNKIESARSNMSPKRRSRSINSLPSTNATPAPTYTTTQNVNDSLPDVGSFISLNDISIVPLNDVSIVSFSNLLNYEENFEHNTQSQNMVDARVNNVVTAAEIHVQESTNEKSIGETEVETVAVSNLRKRIRDQTDFELISICDDVANEESIEETVAICNPQKGVQDLNDFRLTSISGAVLNDTDQLQSDEIIPNGVQYHLGSDLGSKINHSLESTVVHQTSDLSTRESERDKVLDKSDTMCFPTKQTNRSPLVPIQLIIDDPFDKHLKFPESKTEPKKKRRCDTSKFPMAISSEKWRSSILLKEEEKMKKTKDIENRRKIRATLKAQREAKLQEKRVIRRNTIAERKSKLKSKQKRGEPKQKCSMCEDVLISDIEDEGEKNIGCDSCIRWYHLRCTNLSPLPYSEAAEKEYICENCI